MKRSAKENRKRLKQIGVIVPKGYTLICPDCDSFDVLGGDGSDFLTRSTEAILSAGHFAKMFTPHSMTVNLDGTALQEGLISNEPIGIEFEFRESDETQPPIL